MKTVHISKGLSVPLPILTQSIDAEDVLVRHVAWQAPKFTDLRPDSVVKVNQTVAAGDPLFTDTTAPSIHHVAPASGRVIEVIRNGANRLTQINIECDGKPNRYFEIEKNTMNFAGIRELFMQSGVWTRIRQRPYNIVPPTNAQPGEIFVTAIETRPCAPDPRIVISQHQSEFDKGLEALQTQATDTVWVCQSQGEEITSVSVEKLNIVSFTGLHPAGMPSVHIQALCTMSTEQTIWQIGYQDVIAIGHLLLYGEIHTKNVVSLCGDKLRNPRLVNTNVGAKISELLENEVIETNTPTVPIVGSYLSMRSKRWLDIIDHQITVMTKTPFKPLTQSESNPTVRGFVPNPVIDSVNALSILPVPLLRALVSQDIELAEKLGCKDLCAEDMDIFSYVCPEGNNYADFLHNCHQQLVARKINAAGHV